MGPSQLVDEVKVFAGKSEKVTPYTPFPSSLLSADTPTFEKYLKSRSEALLSAISQIFAENNLSTSEVSDLQAYIVRLLSKEKEYVTEVEKSQLETKQMEERLVVATKRYMKAENKLDRARHATVAKLEKQAMGSGRGESGGDDTKKDNLPNEQGISTESLAEVETARKEAVATSKKQQEQLEMLSVENEKLTTQVTTLTTRLTHLTDDDYARTDLFKNLKSQHEDVIKRINDLEAMNVELRAEAEKLQAERTAHRVQLDTEAQAAISEKELQLARAENDLSRIRTARDELHADVQMRKATQDQERSSVGQVKQLAAAREDRVKALESEVERLEIQLGQSENLTPELDQIPIKELRAKYSNLERQYTMLNQELTSMATAFKKASNAASQRIGNLSELEDKVMRFGAEKSRADQKYFAAMKAKDAREQEIRTLRAQNSKSSDMVAQLKDAEASTRALVVNLEKQVAETKEALTNITKQQRSSQQQAAEKVILVDGLKTQVEELKALIVAKDTLLSTSSSATRKAEVEVEQLKVRLEETKKSLNSWKSKGLGNQSEEYEALRVRLSGLGTVCNPVMLTSSGPCTMSNMSEKLQGHCRQDLRARLLQRVRRRAPPIPPAQMSKLQQGVRHQ